MFQNQKPLWNPIYLILCWHWKWWLIRTFSWWNLLLCNFLVNIQGDRHKPNNCSIYLETLQPIIFKPLYTNFNHDVVHYFALFGVQYFLIQILITKLMAWSLHFLVFMFIKLWKRIHETPFFFFVKRDD